MTQPPIGSFEDITSRPEEVDGPDMPKEHAEELDKTIQKAIPLVECFGPTVQGEGTVIGQQTYFLRFGLCDYKCEMCDSLHAVLPQYVKQNAQWLTQEDIYQQFVLGAYKQNSTNWVTFSGGNPVMHDLTYLVGRLKMDGFKINVETQGTMYKKWLNKCESVTFSPKGPGMRERKVGYTDGRILWDTLLQLHEHSPLGGIAEFAWLPKVCIKIVVFDQRDLEYASSIFQMLEEHPIFQASDTSEHFYLSLGNDLPPNADGSILMDATTQAPLDGNEFRNRMLDNYRRLYEDIQVDEVLSKVRFLPQWHTFVWGNDQGH
jgi:7-carboxy-7-deazaguanine synthase